MTPFLAKAAEEVKAGHADAVSVLYPFVDVYLDSQITDVLFDVFCQHSVTDSTVWSDYAFKYEQTVENGISVDYRDSFEGQYAFNKRFGVDPYRVWIDRCRQKGLHPWISVRMNDSHCPDDDASFLRSEFFYEAKEKGYMVGAQYGYFRICYNYAVPEVRDRMLRYLEEQLTRYDTDGIELDFSRELICFDYINNTNCIPVMNQFMRDTKRIVERAEALHGHGIRVGVRLMRDPEQCKSYGFDPETWVKENLVDLICVCPRWATCDSDMPVGAWKSAFPNTEISAGITDLILASMSNFACSPATVAAYAVRYLSDAADSVYLYNFFINPYWLDKPHEKIILEINRTCGHLDTAVKCPLRHIVTYQDVAPVPQPAWHPLPVSLAEFTARISVNIGQIPQDRQCAVILGFHEGNPEMTDIRMNGATLPAFSPVEHGAVEPKYPTFADSKTVLYRTEIAKPEKAVLDFSFRQNAPEGTVVISYLEIEFY